MRKELWLLICSAMAWLCGAFLLLISQSDDPLLDQDEVYWIGSTYYYDLAFSKKDWRHEAWRWLPARENPPVAKYVLGFGLAVAGHRITTIDNLGYYYLRWLRWEKNPEALPTNATEEKRAQVIRATSPGFREAILKNRRAPLSRPVVVAARNTVLVCAVLGSLQLFLLGLLCGGRIMGLVAGWLILIHPIAASAARHAMADTVALLFSSVAVWAIVFWYRRFSRNDVLSSAGMTNSLAVGVMLAIACGAKMNSLVVVLLAGVVVVMTMFQQWQAGAPRAVVRTAVHGVIILISGMVVFAAINPAILNDFSGGMGAVFIEQSHNMSGQEDLHYPRPEGFGGKLSAMITMVFYAWQFFALMVAVVIWAALRHWRNISVRVLVCWWILAFVCVTAWLPFAWPRYTLPVFPPSVLLIGFAIGSGGQWLLKRAGNIRADAALRRLFTGMNPPRRC